MTFEIYSFCLMKAGAGIYSEKSFNGKYMLEVVAAKMETVPGFYAIYSRIFLKIMRTTDLQESVQNSGRDERLNSESGADFYLFWCND